MYNWCAGISCVMLTITFCHTEAPRTTMSSDPMISNGCVECGVVKKSGKHSCCARGGAWFKNCGDAGDTKFDHTWAEGVHACEDSMSALSVKPPLGASIHSPNTTQTLNATKNRANIHHADSMFYVGITDSEDCVGLARVVVCTCVCVHLFACAACVESKHRLRYQLR